MVDETWLQEMVKQDKIKFEQSVSPAALATQELLDVDHETWLLVKQDKIKFEQCFARAWMKSLVSVISLKLFRSCPAAYPRGRESSDRTAQQSTETKGSSKPTRESARVMYVHTLVGAGGKANGSLVDEKSGIRYQPQPL